MKFGSLARLCIGNNNATTNNLTEKKDRRFRRQQRLIERSAKALQAAYRTQAVRKQSRKRPKIALIDHHCCKW